MMYRHRLVCGKANEMAKFVERNGIVDETRCQNGMPMFFCCSIWRKTRNVRAIERKSDKERMKTIKVWKFIYRSLSLAALILFVDLTQSMLSASMRDADFVAVCSMFLLVNSIIQQIVLPLIEWHTV